VSQPTRLSLARKIWYGAVPLWSADEREEDGVAVVVALDPTMTGWRFVASAWVA
jgi:hypothetical protein